MKWNFSILVLVLLVLSGCAQTPSAPPSTATPAPTPSAPSVAPVLPPSETPTKPQGFPDLVWVGKPAVQPLAPIVGDRFHVRQTWRNSGAAATASDFEISVQINKGNTRVFEEHIKVQQPVGPRESRAVDVTPEYAIAEPGDYKVVLILDPKRVVVESKVNLHVSESTVIQVPDLSRLVNFVKEPDASALARAEKDIERYRKGDVTLTIVDSSGKPYAGVKVNYSQIEHSFLFGVFGGGNPMPEVGWQIMREAGLNLSHYAFNWKTTEPESGIWPPVPNITRTVELWRTTGFENNVGRRLIWLGTDVNVLWLPDYISKLSFNDFKSRIYSHVLKLVSTYEKSVNIWHVISEPTTANTAKYTKQQLFEIARESFRAIKDANPTAQTMFNDWNVFEDKRFMPYYDFLQDAIKAGVNFDIIGLENYYNAIHGSDYNYYQQPMRSIASFGESIDKYATLGKRIHVSEMAVPSESLPGKKGYWDMPWSEDLQAEYLRVAFTIFFSKPSVDSISWWDATDNVDFIYRGGLLSGDLKPKKSYYALKQLLRSWTTTGTAVADANGQVGFRGFGGTYEITVTDPQTGRSQKQEVNIQERMQNNVKLVVG